MFGSCGLLYWAMFGPVLSSCSPAAAAAVGDSWRQNLATAALGGGAAALALEAVADVQVPSGCCMVRARACTHGYVSFCWWRWRWEASQQRLLSRLWLAFGRGPGAVLLRSRLPVATICLSADVPGCHVTTRAASCMLLPFASCTGPPACSTSTTARGASCQLASQPVTSRRCLSSSLPPKPPTAASAAL